MTPDDRRLVDEVEALMKVIGAKWKPAIIFCLVFGGRQRFSQLRRALPDITQRMLTLRLRELERDGLVRRHFFAEMPVRVEYEMTPLGLSIHPFFKSLCDWGGAHANELTTARAAYDEHEAG